MALSSWGSYVRIYRILKQTTEYQTVLAYTYGKADVRARHRYDIDFVCMFCFYPDTTKPPVTLQIGDKVFVKSFYLRCSQKRGAFAKSTVYMVYVTEWSVMGRYDYSRLHKDAPPSLTYKGAEYDEDSDESEDEED